MKPLVVRHATKSTTIGEVTVFEGPRGVLAVARGKTDAAATGASIEEKLGAELRVSRRLASLDELVEYFRGKRREFDVPVDLSLVTGFRRRALRALIKVRFGQLVTYGELAARAGSPGGSRAVGGAMRTNPIPFIVPCHRVVAADGSLGGFTGGLDIKRKLHELEGIEPRAGGWPTTHKKTR